MMKKNMLAISMAVALLTYHGLAEEAPAQQSIKEFTVQEAIEYALENHTTLKQAEANVTQNDFAKKEAYDLYVRTRYVNQRYFSDFLVKEGVYYQQALAGLHIAEVALSQTKTGIRTGVELAYFQVINTKKKQALAQNAFDTAQTRLQQVNEQLAQGTSSSLEQMTAQYTLDRVTADLNRAQRASDTALLSLKNAMGLPLSEQLSLSTSEMPLPALPEITAEEAAKLAQLQNANVLGAQDQLNAAQSNFDATAKWYAKNTYAYAQAFHGLSKAKEAYQSAVNNAELAVYAAYDGALSSMDAVSILDKGIALNEKSYEISKQKYDLGMITKIELDDSWYSLQELKLQAADTEYAFYAAVRQFETTYAQ